MSTDNIPSAFAIRQEQESDNQLLANAKSGDQQAFAELCLRHRGMLIKRIYRIVRNPEDAEDIVQETFLKAYQHFHDFRGACSFSTWLMKIGMNSSFMVLRKSNRSFQFLPNQAGDKGQTFEIANICDPAPNPEQLLELRQSSQNLRLAMEKLPPLLNSVIDLYCREDHGLKSTATILGITEAAAKSRMKRARDFLRSALKGRLRVSREKDRRSVQSSRTKALPARP